MLDFKAFFTSFFYFVGLYIMNRNIFVQKKFVFKNIENYRKDKV